MSVRENVGDQTSPTTKHSKQNDLLAMDKQGSPLLELIELSEPELPELSPLTHALWSCDVLKRLC